jgi:hypothetical protein
MLQSLPLSRVSEVVCALYEIKSKELSRRGSRHPARAALAYLWRSRTMATNTELGNYFRFTQPDTPIPNSDWPAQSVKRVVSR